MATNGQTTQTDNATYNLVSVLYHALEGSVTYQKYAHDAASDNELQQYFTRIAQQTDESAQEAKRLLKERL